MVPGTSSDDSGFPAIDNVDLPYRELWSGESRYTEETTFVLATSSNGRRLPGADFSTICLLLEKCREFGANTGGEVRVLQGLFRGYALLRVQS